MTEYKRVMKEIGLIGKIKRFFHFSWIRLYKHFFILFYQRPVYRDLKDRKGGCKRCGYCCETARCPLLSYDEKGKSVCKLYNTPMFPWKCSIGPIRMDIKYGKCGENCGFYYDDVKPPKF